MQGGFGGLVWGVVSWNWGVSELSGAPSSARQQFSSAAVRRAVVRDAARSATLFGAVLGGFVGAKCVASQARQKDDWINSWTGGLTVGLVLGSAHCPSPRQGAAVAIACSSFAGLSHVMWA